MQGGVAHDLDDGDGLLPMTWQTGRGIARAGIRKTLSRTMTCIKIDRLQDTPRRFEKE